MFYSKCFSWTERGLHERRKNDFPLIYLGWADFLRVFSSYFFPHYSVFPIHLLSSLCSLSPMPLLQRCETFLPQKPGKNCQVAFVIVSQCDTDQSFSILTDFTFCVSQNPQPWAWVARCHHLVSPNLCWLIKLLSLFCTEQPHFSCSISWKRNASQN